MNTQINISHKQLFKLSLVGLIAAMLLIMIAGNKASAQDRAITLKEAIDLGLNNSKTLKLSQSKIDEAISQYNQAKDQVLPTGSVSATYDRAQIPYNSLAFGKESLKLPKSANAYLGIGSLKETIFAGGKLRYAQQSTQLLTQVSRLDAEKDKDEIT